MTRRLDALTALRFFASIHIVLHHYGSVAFETAPSWLEALRQRAHISLTIFFIMSGFVISYRYLEPLATRQSTREDFWRTRFARVFPLYYLTWLIETGVRIVYGSKLVHSEYLAGSVAHLLGLQAWVRSLGSSANVPAWTVSTELAFYALFPFVAARFAAAGRRGLLIAVGVLTVVAMLPHIADRIVHFDKTVLSSTTPYLFAWAKYRWPPLRAAEFLLGVVLGKLYTDGGERRNVGVALAIAGALGTVPLLTLPTAFLPPHEIWHALYIPLSALVIYGLAHVRGPQRPAIRGPLVALGDASYAIYIFQTPVFFVVTRTLVPGWEIQPWFLAEYLTVLLTVSFMAHLWVERPLYDYLRGR